METRKDGTVFVRLPSNMQRKIEFGCDCSYCKAHPTKPPMWDTLAAHPDKYGSWLVHYPELSR